MAKNPNAAFDIGPLSWVKSEIEHSLTETRTHLETLAGNPGDAKAFKFAASHLHQVTGALTMVGLGAATRFNEEVEIWSGVSKAIQMRAHRHRSASVPP